MEGLYAPPNQYHQLERTDGPRAGISASTSDARKRQTAPTDTALLPTQRCYRPSVATGPASLLAQPCFRFRRPAVPSVRGNRRQGFEFLRVQRNSVLLDPKSKLGSTWATRIPRPARPSKSWQRADHCVNFSCQCVGGFAAAHGICAANGAAQLSSTAAVGAAIPATRFLAPGDPTAGAGVGGFLRLRPIEACTRGRPKDSVRSGRLGEPPRCHGARFLETGVQALAPRGDRPPEVHTPCAREARLSSPKQAARKPVREQQNR